MAIKTRAIRRLCLACACLALSSLAQPQAQNPDADDEVLTSGYGDLATVNIATGNKQDLRRASATATVITAQDIAAMGATELDQVLESVPGLHASIHYQGAFPIYSFRGLQRGLNPQVLMLVNGSSLNNAFTGNRGQLTGAFPLENIQRIEVIRGPGSALYGANAYAGVINLITKTADDIGGVVAGARLGTFNARDAWLQYGGNWGPVRAAVYLAAASTDGYNSIIDRDLQSSLDTLFSTHASFAPGPIALKQNGLDASLDLSYADWRLRASYRARKLGLGAGIAESLDPNARFPTSRFMFDLGYQRTNWRNNWDLAVNLDYQDYHQDSASPNPYIFPPGGLNGLFPDGAIGNPTNKERHTGLGVTLAYTGFHQHKLRMGMGYRVEDMYQTSEIKNFQVNDIPGVGPVIAPLPGGLVNAQGDNPGLVYLVPTLRSVNYVFAQDEWRFANDWALTLGLRTDNYSDFGSTTNPRLALVWDARQDLVVKLLHGRAFRAPSLVEEYPGVNPTQVGNPNIKPETITTDELVFAWQPQLNLQTNLTLFQTRERNIIQYVRTAANLANAKVENLGGQTGRGLELEVQWNVHRDLRLSSSYSLQHTTVDASGKDAGLAPRRRIYFRSDWRFASQWQWGAAINHVADRAREPGDTRPPIADYTTVDMSLHKRNLWGGNWALQLGVKNLFNADAREPSYAPGNIPNDLPLAGRSASLQLQRNF